jgi:hypothetical protein
MEEMGNKPQDIWASFCRKRSAAAGCRSAKRKVLIQEEADQADRYG